MSIVKPARRRAVGAIALSAAVAATALVVPLSAAHAAPTTLTFGDTLAASGWTGSVASAPTNWDFEILDANTLRASNWQTSNNRGAINQLLSPTTTPAGEPFYTNAANDTFSVSFTLGSGVEGEDAYKAQPNLALELAVDRAGNRAGSGLTFRVPEDGVLELSNYYSLPGDLGEIWRNDVAEVPFDGPVDITYTVKFVPGGKDRVVVTVDGEQVLEGAGTYEGYTWAANGTAGTVNGILLRAIARTPGVSPSDASWVNVTLTTEQNAALKGKGLTFSDISYESSDSGDHAYGTGSTSVVQLGSIDTYEDDNPASAAYNYNRWHVVRGDDNDPDDSIVSVDDGALVLHDPVRNGRAVQVLKGFAIGDGPTDLAKVVAEGLAWETTEGTGFFQIPVFSINENGDREFRGTLRPVSPVVGFNHVALDQMWRSTRAIGTINQNASATLGSFIEQLENAYESYEVAGFGVASGGNIETTVISAIHFLGTKYTFGNEPVLSLSAAITGTPNVGNVLKAVPTGATGATFTYQWYRNGTAISKAKGSTYTLVAADRGKQISVKITAKKSGFKTVSKTSAKTAKIGYGTIVADGMPTITGDLKVGAKLGVALPAYTPKVSVKYQWYRDGVAIKKATKASYTLVAADLGAEITVKVTASASGYTSLPLTSEATDEVEAGIITVSKAPTIKGTVKVGKTLTATSTGWSPSSVTKKYAWYADGELIQLSTSNKLKLTWAEKGAVITVKVVGSKQGYTKAESALSAPTVAVK